MSGGFDWSQLEVVAKQAYTMYAEHQGGGQHPDQPAHHQAIQAAQQHIQSGTHEDPDVENVTQAHSEIYQGGDQAGEAAVRKFKAANGVDPRGEETGGGSDGGAGAKVVGGAILKKVLERQHASGQQSAGSQGSLIAQVMNEASQLLAAHPEIKQQVLTQVTTMVMKAQVGHSSGGGSSSHGGGAGGLVGQLMSQLNGGGGSQGSGKGGFDIGSVLKML